MYTYEISVFSYVVKLGNWSTVSDFDNDNHIGCDDICTALKLLTHNELTIDEMNQVYDKAMEEGDVDGDGKLSLIEFQHVILRSPEFFSTFHIRM